MTEVVGWQGRYERAKQALLTDPGICAENRELFRRYFEHEEYKLKRTNNLRVLDNPAYKTLYVYIGRFRHVNRWFRNKPLTGLTREEIKRVYDELEDGVIRNEQGRPYKSRADYYAKIFKSTLFRLAGKDHLAREVITYARPNPKEVRFILEADFRRLVEGATKPLHKLLFWLAFDLGENINSLLRLRRGDCYREMNPDTNEPEYRINLRQEILKRSRRARAEVTNFPETVTLLDQHLRDKEPGEDLFPFDYRNAKKIIDRAAARTGVRCHPGGDKVSWKDLRSGMACDLLKKGWTVDEVNARLGHKPSSAEIDKYVNFLALDRRRPKRKVHQFKIDELKTEIDTLKEHERRQRQRNQDLHARLDDVQQQLGEVTARLLRELQAKHDLPSDAGARLTLHESGSAVQALPKTS